MPAAAHAPPTPAVPAVPTVPAAIGSARGAAPHSKIWTQNLECGGKRYPARRRFLQRPAFRSGGGHAARTADARPSRPPRDNRGLEGECPHEPPFRCAEGYFGVHCGAPGGQVSLARGGRAPPPAAPAVPQHPKNLRNLWCSKPEPCTPKKSLRLRVSALKNAHLRALRRAALLAASCSCWRRSSLRRRVPTLQKTPRSDPAPP